MILIAKIIRIYVNTKELPRAGYGIGSANAELSKHYFCSQYGPAALSGAGDHQFLNGNRILSEREQQAIIMVEGFCDKKGYKFEIIDAGIKGALSKLKLKTKGLTDSPAITFQDRVIHGVPTEEMLNKLVR